MKSIGVVKNIWRYPVKSMLGERHHSMQVDGRGVLGDRLFAVRDERGKLGSGKDTRRFVKIDGLFRFRAAYDKSVPVIIFPGGKSVRGDDSSIHSKLSEVLSQPVTLAKEQLIQHFDNAPVHLVTTASLDWLRAKLPGSTIDESRFRPNVLLETDNLGLVEKQWVGERLRIGGVILEITHSTKRCQMVNFAQSSIPHDKSILTCIGREAGLKFGAYARVLAPGQINCGEEVEII